MRGGAATSTLVHQHYAVVAGVEEAAAQAK
jgi:hypothetical protein